MAVAVIRRESFAAANKDGLSRVDGSTYCGATPPDLPQACVKELDGGTLLVGITRSAGDEVDVREVTREIYQRL